MRKAITTFLIIGILCGGFYFCLQQGYIDQWFPGMMENIIPGYESKDKENGGRVSSNAADAVFVDSVLFVADLGSGNGLIPRFAGTVESQETREYKLEGDRKVKKCFVKEGDLVKTGQKLFTYDTTEDESKLEQAKIDLERLENTEDTSEKKKEELEKQKAAADTPEKKLEVLTAENELKQNELDQKSKKKEIEQLEEQIKNATVTSSMDGVVKSVNEQTESLDMMGTSETAYITILKVGTYRVKAQANEQNISQIYNGEQVLVFSRVDSKQFWRGSISEIKTDQGNSEENSNDSYYYGDNSSGSTNYPFYVELEDSEGLMLGQHVYLEENLGQENAKEGLWLDDYYIVTQEDGSSYVWAASDKNRLEKRTVTLGEADEELSRHQILSGLSEEDYICVPRDGLEEGLPVNYNDASGEGETESMYNWSMGFDETEDYNYDELYGEDFFYSDEFSGEDFLYSDEFSDADAFYEDYSDETEYMILEDGSGVYVIGDDDITYDEDETDEDGYIIMD